MGEEKKYKLENRIFLVSILILILVILLIYFLSRDHWALWAYGDVENRNGLLMKDIISMIGGLVIIGGLYISFMRSRAFQRSVEKQNDQLKNQQTEISLTREANLNEQFKNAVEHLGSDKEPIVLGGVAELNGLASNSPDKFAQVVVDILTSYCRSEASINKPPEEIKWSVVQLAMNNLSSNSVYYQIPVNLDHTDLRNIILSPIIILEAWSFNNSFFPKTCSEALFTMCEFSETKFYYGKYVNLNFEKSNFRKINAEHSYFQDCSFNNDHSISGYFLNSTFLNHSFDASLHFVSFWNCKFLGEFKAKYIDQSDFKFSIFRNGKFYSDYIDRTEFEGCNFEEYVMDCEIDSICFKGTGKIKRRTDLKLNVIRSVEQAKNDFSGVQFKGTKMKFIEKDLTQLDGFYFINDYNDKLLNKSQEISSPKEWSPKF
mgnify:CR=1 FL=1